MCTQHKLAIWFCSLNLWRLRKLATVETTKVSNQQSITSGHIKERKLYKSII